MSFSLTLNQMLFTWDTRNLCIVFRQWRVTGTSSLIFSLLAIVLLTAGYELVREISRRYEARCAQESIRLPSKCCGPTHTPGRSLAWGLK